MTDGDTEDHRRITDENVDMLRRRIGIRVKRDTRAHVVVTTEDAIRHFAYGVGQDDPIYCDPAYAIATAWGSVIAPPLYFAATGIREPVEWTAEEAKAMSGGDPLAGIGQYMVREQWTFHEPVRPGVTLMQRQMLHDVEDRLSNDGRRSLRVTHKTTHLSTDGVPYATTKRTFHHAERSLAGASGGAASLEPPSYDEAALSAIDDCYAAETVRGADPLRLDEVATGNGIGTIVRGPLTVTDILGYHVGVGWGGFGVPPSRLAWKARQRMPRLFVPNGQGVPDTVQRCHWEDDWARSLGQPLSYDYGAMRSNWATALIRNWMGDTGWLWKFESRILKFNHRGDTTWLSGFVSGIDASESRVEIQIEGINQRGVQTCTATATLVLPRQGDELPKIPAPDRA